jgi:coenzyme F420-0:L-glutamate ligase/coenzyme F420-1:gamma-L-glutamate ligase
MSRLEILPVTGIGEVQPGDDVAALIATAAPWLRDGDVVVVTSKIVSKAEGQLVEVPTTGPERESARERILASETARPVARRGHTRIVQTHHGYVMASAGIDASNVERTQLVLLPKDPDLSARSLRAVLRERLGVDVAVIISDTMGRPWRVGLIDVALGIAGLDGIRDYRGEVDAYGNELHITQMAVADELASAAELVKNKSDQVPVVVVRGFPGTSTADGPGGAALIRRPEHDLFSLGTAEARSAGLREAAALGDADTLTHDPVDPAVLDRVVTDPRFVHIGGSQVAGCLDGEPTPAALLGLGEGLQRLRAALAAEGLAGTWRFVDDLVVDGRRAVGVLTVGWPG